MLSDVFEKATRRSLSGFYLPLYAHRVVRYDVRAWYFCVPSIVDWDVYHTLQGRSP